MEYYIAYFYNTGTQTGVGGCTISVSKRITTGNDISNIQKEIQKTNNFKEVVILNWKRL